MSEIWTISNRQPWVEALAAGIITSKTRSASVNLPPVGATVYLHASKALWRYWRDLWWLDEFRIDMETLPRGGVVAVARVAAKGLTETVMPPSDREYFDLGWVGGNCADVQTIVFEDIKRIKFIPCRGSLVPTRKLPAELSRYIRGKRQ